MAFCVWLLSLSTMFSRFTHVIARVRALSLSMAEYYSTVWMGCVLFIHSPNNGHLGDFRFLTAVSRAAVNIHVHVFTEAPLTRGFASSHQAVAQAPQRQC